MSCTMCCVLEGLLQVALAIDVWLAVPQALGCPCFGFLGGICSTGVRARSVLFLTCLVMAPTSRAVTNQPREM